MSGDRSLATAAASQIITLSVLGALGLGGLGYVFIDDVLRVIGPSPQVLELATVYMRLISLGLVFLFGFVTFMALMRGAGNTVTPMLVVAGSVGLNIALDPFLIFGWGPSGVWLSIAATNLVGAVLAYPPGRDSVTRQDTISIGTDSESRDL